MISIQTLSDTLLTHCKGIETLEVQVERELNALQLRRPTTTVIRVACLGKYPTCALASATYTSVVSEGGARDTSRIVQIHINEQAIRVRAPDQRGVRTCVVGIESKLWFGSRLF